MSSEVAGSYWTMARNRIGLALGVVVALGLGIVACSDDEPADAGPDSSADASDDGGKNDGGSTDAGPEDTGPADTGPKDADADPDADADAGPIPGLVTDLAGTTDTFNSVKLTWTAPSDYTGSGTVVRYDIRWSTTPITTDAEFLAGDVATPPTPVAPGGAQTTTIEGLTPATQYYVALRAQYDNDGYGPRSQTVTVTTKGRAKFLITEVAPHNTAASGGDFVELVATRAGLATGLIVYTGYNEVLHTFAPLEVQIGDRIVVHASGLPGPTGYVQEDTANSKTASTSTYASANAYDVYSDRADVIDSMGTIMVAEPGDLFEKTDFSRTWSRTRIAPKPAPTTSRWENPGGSLVSGLASRTTNGRPRSHRRSGSRWTTGAKCPSKR
ncbi:MAG: hypothetical protein K0S65_1619 [Labilithrix sp.]|nr:hypothetical protein [Labilithrix sp.]